MTADFLPVCVDGNFRRVLSTEKNTFNLAHQLANCALTTPLSMLP